MKRPQSLQLSVCPQSRRLAFASGPSPTLAAPPSASPSAAPSALGPNLPPLSSLSPTERALQVFVAASSNLFNGFIFGGLFGLVSGAWSTRSFRGAFAEARSNGKSWGTISAVYAGLQTASKVIRGRDDRYNAIVGACGSGAAFSIKGGPAAAAQGCVSFAALSYLIDMLTASKIDDQSDEAILNKKSR